MGCSVFSARLMFFPPHSSLSADMLRNCGSFRVAIVFHIKAVDPNTLFSPLLFRYFLFSFERTYDKLMSVERTFEAQGAKKILDCIRSDQNNELLVHNYYNNKFDATGTCSLDFDSFLFHLMQAVGALVQHEKHENRLHAHVAALAMLNVCTEMFLY